jgi:hypothetical protein
MQQALWHWRRLKHSAQGAPCRESLQKNAQAYVQAWRMTAHAIATTAHRPQ